MPRGCVAEGVRVRVARGARPSLRRSRAAKWGCAEGARVQRKTVCRGADGKQVGARGAHVHLMTDVARARTSSACPPPPPGRKNLDVGVVRSGSHHSADSTHTRTHTHRRVQCMLAVHASSACVQCVRAVRARSQPLCELRCARTRSDLLHKLLRSRRSTGTAVPQARAREVTP